jgi:hypothetical protein
MTEIGIAQLGFTTMDNLPRTCLGEGVGDLENSWAYDGERCLKFNMGQTGLENMPYGKKWSNGTCSVGIRSNGVIFVI